MSPPIKILIADDHRILLDGIVALLQTEPGFEVVGTAIDGYEALEIISCKKVDVCLLDISMPRLDGMAVAKQLSEKGLFVKVIILTTYNDKEIIAEMLQVGVAGYILKNSSRDELITAIKKVSEGGTYFSDEIYAGIMKDYLQQLGKSRNVADDAILTTREIEVLRLLAKELTNEKIAKELNISYRTVETHRKNIMQKTKSHNLAGLLRFAYGKGLIS